MTVPGGAGFGGDMSGDFAKSGNAPDINQNPAVVNNHKERLQR
jgi:hypothetical protein